MTSRWTEILTLYRWDLRSALRDRTIVVNSVILPLVLYPLMLWVMFTGITFVRGQTDDLASRVALVDLPPRHEELRRGLADDDRFQIVDSFRREAAIGEQVRTGELDAAVIFGPGDRHLDGNFRARLIFDESRERSALARTRLVEAVDAYRERWLRGEALARGLAAADWSGFAIEQRNSATGRDMGTLVLGLMLPVFFVVMVSLGCLHPAIDATAGERERNTWETLMTTALSRQSIVTAKYLTVTTLGGLAGLLNVVAMLLTMRGVLGPLVGRDSDVLEFSLPISAIPVLVVGAVLLAGFLGAGMMLLASFARSFREGQSMVTPFYLATLLPIMFLGSPGTQLTLPLALVPVVNIALVVREAFGGVVKPLETLVAVAATVVAIGLLIRLSTAVLAVENVVIGSYSGSLVTFLRDRLRGRAPRASA